MIELCDFVEEAIPSYWICLHDFFFFFSKTFSHTNEKLKSQQNCSQILLLIEWNLVLLYKL